MYSCRHAPTDIRASRDEARDWGALMRQRQYAGSPAAASEAEKSVHNTNTTLGARSSQDRTVVRAGRTEYVTLSSLYPVQRSQG